MTCHNGHHPFLRAPGEFKPGDPACECGTLTHTDYGKTLNGLMTWTVKAGKTLYPLTASRSHLRWSGQGRR